jgi:hypothetical protein
MGMEIAFNNTQLEVKEAAGATLPTEAGSAGVAESGSLATIGSASGEFSHPDLNPRESKPNWSE